MMRGRWIIARAIATRCPLAAGQLVGEAVQLVAQPQIGQQRPGLGGVGLVLDRRGDHHVSWAVR